MDKKEPGRDPSQRAEAEPANNERRCPQCRGAMPAQRTAAFPFCSDRCKLLDLGAWASERYIIAGRSVEDAKQPSSTTDEADQE